MNAGLATLGNALRDMGVEISTQVIIQTIGVLMLKQDAYGINTLRFQGDHNGLVRRSSTATAYCAEGGVEEKQGKPEDADIYTLAVLTAQKGDKISMFANIGIKTISHGKTADGRAWGIPEALARGILDEKLRWTAHSHPMTIELY